MASYYLAEELRTRFQYLNQTWNSTAEGWEDSVRYQYEQIYWTSLEKTVMSTIQEIRTLEHILAQARQQVK